MRERTRRDCIGGGIGQTGTTLRSVAWPLLLTGALSLGNPLEGCDASEAAEANREDEGLMALVARVKQDELQARAELERVRGAGEPVLEAELNRIADSHRLAGEATRQAFLAVVEPVKDPARRARLLRKLLAAAPITPATGRRVLRLAAQSGDDAALASVLEYFHQIRESDLVRGPIAAEYLDAVERLSSPAQVATALQNLLHPQRVEKATCTRALVIADRVQEGADVVKVLREVTDHQQVDGDVERLYVRLAARASPQEQRVLAERLAEAGVRPRLVVVKRRQDAGAGWDDGDTARLQLKLESLRERMKGLEERLEGQL